MLAFMPGFFELLIVGFILLILVVPFWMICSKAGFPGWISLAMLLPLLNLALLFFLAFADWPALRRLPDNDEMV
ncbi:MAG: hypothetical protein WD065_01565 [Planctomycetaceae bacterium]